MGILCIDTGTLSLRSDDELRFLTDDLELHDEGLEQRCRGGYEAVTHLGKSVDGHARVGRILLRKQDGKDYDPCE